MKSKLINNFLIFFFLGIWIIPVGYYGLANSAPFWLYDPLAEKANVSRLFAKLQPSWSIYELQIREDGAGDFHPVSEAIFFDRQPFGYGTHFQRLMAFSTKDQLKELSNWLNDRLNKQNRKITALRFVYFDAPAPLSSQVTGHYVQPTSDLLDPKAIHSVAEYEFPR